RAGARLQGQSAAGAGETDALAPHPRGAARRGDRRRRPLLGEPRPVKSQFKFLSGARVGQTEAFVKAYVGLGRHPLSYVRFDPERDLDVSARHAAVVRRGDTFIIQDLGSRNGTLINGTRIEGDTPLHDGDVIGFGAKGPALEFRILSTEDAVTRSTVAEAAAAHASQPREILAAVRAGSAPPSPPPPPPPPPPLPIAGGGARPPNPLRPPTNAPLAPLF